MIALRSRYFCSTFVALLLASQSQAEPILQSLTPLSTELVSAEQVQQHSARLQEAVSQIPTLNPLPVFSAGARGSAQLRPLFSAQSGSWPFESFVHAGLFKVIAGYQTSHPRMIAISGDITIAQVQQQINDNQVIRRHNDGYLLSYPLMVNPGATLRIDNTKLYLFAHSGAAIINQGRLQISNSQVESYSGESSGQGRAYRPFIMAWAGSQTRIVDSQLNRLGYNAHLARGFSTARSSQQATSVPAARVLISNSQIDQLSSIYLQDAQALIENSQIRNMQMYGVESLNSQLELKNNQVEQVRNHGGVRLSGNSQARMSHNQIRQSAKSSLILRNFNGLLLAQQNQLGQSASNAVQIRQMSAEGIAVLHGNSLHNVPMSLIDAETSGSLLLSGNRFEQANHAIVLTGSGQTLIIDNQFANLEEAAIKSEGPSNITLGGNQFDGKVLLQRLFQGDLLAIQSTIVENTIKHACYLQIGQTAQKALSNTEICDSTPN